MSHSHKDAPGGHLDFELEGKGWVVGWSPCARRYLKKRTKREKRREGARIIREALALLAADVADDWRAMIEAQVQESEWEYLDYLSELERDYRPRNTSYYDDYYDLYDDGHIDLFDLFDEPLFYRTFSRTPIITDTTARLSIEGYKPSDGSQDGGSYLEGDF